MCIHTVKNSSIYEVMFCLDSYIPGNCKSQSSLPHWLCTSGQPSCRHIFLCNPFCIHIAAAPLMTQQPQEEWSTLASGLLVQSNPSSQWMALRVQLRLHYPQQCPPWFTALLICCTRAALVGGIVAIVHPFFVSNSNSFCLVRVLLPHRAIVR